MNKYAIRTLLYSLVSFSLGMAVMYFSTNRKRGPRFAAATSVNISWDEARTMMDLYNRDVNSSSLKMIGRDGRETVLKGFRFDANQIRSVLDRNPNGAPNELVLCFGATPARNNTSSPEIHIIAMGSKEDVNNPNGSLLIPSIPALFGRSINSGIFDHANPIPPNPVSVQ